MLTFRLRALPTSLPRTSAPCAQAASSRSKRLPGTRGNATGRTSSIDSASHGHPLTSADGSVTYWEHRKAIEKAVRADPNTLELLFVETARATDPIGEWILEARDAFASADLFGSFGRYAVSQLGKLSRSRGAPGDRGAQLVAPAAPALPRLRGRPAPRVGEGWVPLGEEAPLRAPDDTDRDARPAHGRDRDRRHGAPRLARLRRRARARRGQAARRALRADGRDVSPLEGGGGARFRHARCGPRALSPPGGATQRAGGRCLAGRSPAAGARIRTIGQSFVGTGR